MKVEFIPYDTTITDFKVTNSAAIDERIDETLDGGNVQLIMPTKTPLNPMSAAKLKLYDETGEISEDFFLFDTVEKRGKNYYAHSITLCEPTRLFMGQMIDGLRITQHTDGSAKKSLYSAIQRVLKNYTLKGYNSSSAFTLDADTTLTNILQNTESPEFAWQAETLLFEVLCDIGNVINAIPRLKYPNLITFDFVNQITGEAEL